MSALLSSYESDYRSTFDEARSGMQRAITQALSERNLTLSQVEQQQEELGDLIDQMEIEVNSAIQNGQERANYKAKLRGYRKQVQSDLRQPLQQLIDSTDRDLLFGEQNHQFDHLDDEQRQQLLSNHSILQGTGDRLRDATRIATETEGIGSNIMNDLRSQRETLENARQTLFTADSYVDKSIRTLKTMSRRLVANKFISYAIIAVLILLILLVLFSKFRS
ncbi:VPS10-interacting protein 1 [Zygosaccharomyces mellis]|uniref:VPS10-interacting protein 1 n=1 Tax=Zygosaccharomyces mellis TaxID=42258 RepID=A0A4C2E9D6_9SACH|nr:VPS10-interacting protein 1 [Zygosaccharomyces mellis]